MAVLCTTTPSGWLAIRLPSTSARLESVGLAGLSSTQANVWGSQPRIRVAPASTRRFPPTDNREWPVCVVSLSANAATSTAPGATVRLSSTRAGPAFTSHAPTTRTDSKLPARTPGAVGLPVQTCVSGPLAAAVPGLAATKPTAIPPALSAQRSVRTNLIVDPHLGCSCRDGANLAPAVGASQLGGAERGF